MMKRDTTVLYQGSQGIFASTIWQERCWKRRSAGFGRRIKLLSYDRRCQNQIFMASPPPASSLSSPSEKRLLLLLPSSIQELELRLQVGLLLLPSLAGAHCYYHVLPLLISPLFPVPTFGKKEGERSSRKSASFLFYFFSFFKNGRERWRKKKRILKGE